MPQFFYKAMNDSGENLQGTILADSTQHAKYILIKDGFVPLQIRRKKRAKKVILKGSYLIDFTAELAQLLQASVPLHQALSLLEESYRSSKYHVIILDILEALNQGKSFSQALEQYSSSFSPIYIAMVRSSEKTATLADALQDIVQLLEGQRRIKKCCMAALAYPAVLFTFAIVILLAFIFFIVPSFFDLFEGKKLGGLTATVFNISHFAVNHSYLVMFGIQGVILSFVLAMKLRCLKKVFLRLPIPFLKAFLLQSALVRFSRTCSVLLGRGVPLVDSLKMAIPVLNHPSLELAISDAYLAVMEGKPLSAALKHHSLIPNMILKMIAIGENSGKLEKIFKHISTIYEADINKKFMLMQTFLQPIVLLIIGALIGTILLAIMVPLTDVSALL